MKRWMRAVCGFFALNLLVVLPLFWFLTEDVADIVTVAFETKSPFTLRVHTAAEDLVTVYFSQRDVKNGRARFYLPKRCDADELRFSFTGAANDVVLKSVSLYRRFLIAKRLDGAGVLSGYDGIDGATIASSDAAGVTIKLYGGQGSLVPRDGRQSPWQMVSLSDGYARMAIAGIELMLVLLSALMCLIVPPAASNRYVLFRVTLVAFFAAGFVGVILPLQSFLVNESMFTFGMADLLACTVGRAVLGFVAIAVVLYVSYRLWGGLLTTVLTASIIYLYLETGIFSIGDLQLNGELVGFLDGTRVLWDTAALLLIVGVGAIFHRKLFPIIHWIVLAFVVLSVETLIEAKRELRNEHKEYIVSDFFGRKDVAESSSYSTNRNVIVFVLDMTTSEVTEDVMKRDPELRAKFDGFVCYRNNLGMHMYTPQGTAAIFTGTYLQDPSQLISYINSKFSEKSFFKPYLDADLPMFIMPGDVAYAYTNRLRKKEPGEFGNNDKASWENPLFARIKGDQKWNMFEILTLRATPYALKKYVFKMCMWGWPINGMYSTEEELYGALKKNIRLTGAPVTLHYYHTDGTHEPLTVDRYGHPLPEAQFGYEAHVEKLWYALQQLGSLLDDYRANGVYDKSLIVICSDHGGEYENGASFVKGITPKALPCLWVKQEGNRIPWSACDVPTTHANIAKLIKLARQGPLGAEEITDVLRSEDRVYRRINGSDVIDYHVDGAGSVRIQKSTMTKRPSDLKPLKSGVEYSFDVNDRSRYADFLCEGLEMDLASPRFIGDRETMRLCVRVQDSSKTYDVTLNTDLYGFGDNQYDPSTKILFAAADSTTSSELVFSGLSASVTIKNVKPDGDGVLCITGTRSGNNVALFFRAIKVTVNK